MGAPTVSSFAPEQGSFPSLLTAPESAGRLDTVQQYQQRLLANSLEQPTSAPLGDPLESQQTTQFRMQGLQANFQNNHTSARPELLGASSPQMTSRSSQRLQQQQLAIDLRRQLCDQNLFVFHLPSQWDEEELRREFGKFGSILSAKVVKRPDGSSKGYGFVCFTESLAACQAVEAMNGKPYAGKRLKVSLKKTPEECLHLQVQKLMEISNANQPYDRDRDCTLFVFHLPSSWDDKEMYEHFQSFGTLLSAKIAKRPDGLSRGYGFVTYDNPRAAALAIANMNGVDVGNNKRLKVQLKQQANPQQPVPGCTIFIFHLPNDWTDNHLRQHFNHYGKIVGATVQRDNRGNSRGYGFISFDRQQSALNAVIGMNGFSVGHKRLKVSLKKGECSELPPAPQAYLRHNDMSCWDAAAAAAAAAAAIDFGTPTVTAQASLSSSARVAAMAAALQGATPATTVPPAAYAPTSPAHPYTTARLGTMAPPVAGYPATPNVTTGFGYPPPYSSFLPWGLTSQQRLRR